MTATTRAAPGQRGASPTRAVPQHVSPVALLSPGHSPEAGREVEHPGYGQASTGDINVTGNSLTHRQDCSAKCDNVFKVKILSKSQETDQTPQARLAIAPAFLGEFCRKLPWEFTLSRNRNFPSESDKQPFLQSLSCSLLLPVGRPAVTALSRTLL